MKKIVSLVLVCAMALTLAACGTKTPAETNAPETTAPVETIAPETTVPAETTAPEAETQAPAASTEFQQKFRAKRHLLCPLFQPHSPNLCKKRALRHCRSVCSL